MCVAADKVLSCERIGDVSWSEGVYKTCYMKNATVDSADFEISSSADTTIRALHFGDNKQIRFLPENIAQKFPNLAMLYAGYCSIEIVSYVNFKGLGNLRWLHLQTNGIEKIDSNVFKDLLLLEELFLREYLINKY